MRAASSSPLSGSRSEPRSHAGNGKSVAIPCAARRSARGISYFFCASCFWYRRSATTAAASARAARGSGARRSTSTPRVRRTSLTERRRIRLDAQEKLPSSLRSDAVTDSAKARKSASSRPASTSRSAPPQRARVAPSCAPCSCIARVPNMTRLSRNTARWVKSTSSGAGPRAASAWSRLASALWNPAVVSSFDSQRWITSPSAARHSRRPWPTRRADRARTYRRGEATTARRRAPSQPPPARGAS